MNWKTASGEEIPISEMEDGHLINCIRYLSGMKEKVNRAIHEDCARANPLEAWPNVDESLTRQLCWVESYLQPMKEELNKRGLEGWQSGNAAAC